MKRLNDKLATAEVYVIGGAFQVTQGIFETEEEFLAYLERRVLEHAQVRIIEAYRRN